MTAPNSRTIGQRIRQLRRGLGLTGTELGRRAGLTNCQISRLEHGLHGLQQATMLRFCRALEVDPVYFHVEDQAIFTARAARELKACGRTLSRDLRGALANAAFLRYAERCAALFRASQGNLPRLEKLLGRLVQRVG